MARKKRQQQTDLDIPDYQLDSLARVLLPILQDYLLSEQGKKDYAEWTAQKQPNKNDNKKESC